MNRDRFWLKFSQKRFEQVCNTDDEMQSCKHYISFLQTCRDSLVHAALLYWCRMFGFQEVLGQASPIFNDSLTNWTNWQPAVTNKSLQCFLSMFNASCITVKSSARNEYFLKKVNKSDIRSSTPHDWSTLYIPAWKPLWTTCRLQLPMSMRGFPPSCTIDSFNWFFRLLLTLGPSHPRCNIFTRGKQSFDKASMMLVFRSPARACPKNEEATYLRTTLSSARLQHRACISNCLTFWSVVVSSTNKVYHEFFMSLTISSWKYGPSPKAIP